MLTVEQIAEVAHNTNKACCESFGDMSQPKWCDQTQELKGSAIEGVKLHLANPNISPEESHNSWMEQKTKDGWKFGDSKDLSTKEHPSMVAFTDLTPEIKCKDLLFKAVCNSLACFCTEVQPTVTETSVVV